MNDVELKQINGHWYDIVYSPDDGGWYGQDRENRVTVNLFKSKTECIKAIKDGEKFEG